jgi:hypothetical protein
MSWGPKYGCPRRVGRVDGPTSRVGRSPRRVRPPERALARAPDGTGRRGFNAVSSDGGVPVRRTCRCPPGHPPASCPSGPGRCRRPHARTRRTACRSRRALTRAPREHGRRTAKRGPGSPGRGGMPEGKPPIELTGRASTCEPSGARARSDVRPFGGGRGVASFGWPRIKGRKARGRTGDRAFRGTRPHLPGIERSVFLRVDRAAAREVSRFAGRCPEASGPVAASGGRGDVRRGARAGQARSRHASARGGFSSSPLLPQGLPSRGPRSVRPFGRRGSSASAKGDGGCRSASW